MISLTSTWRVNLPSFQSVDTEGVNSSSLGDFGSFQRLKGTRRGARLFSSFKKSGLDQHTRVHGMSKSKVNMKLWFPNQKRNDVLNANDSVNPEEIQEWEGKSFRLPQKRIPAADKIDHFPPKASTMTLILLFMCFSPPSHNLGK